MKNPDNKPLRIVRKAIDDNYPHECNASYALMLSNLAIAESNLIRAGKDSAMPHFLAIIKELERLHEFHFEIAE